MPQLIEVPGYGPTEFPDGMSDEDIVKVIKANELPEEPSTAVGAAGRSLRTGGGLFLGKPLQNIGFRLQQAGREPIRAAPVRNEAGQAIAKPSAVTGPGPFEAQGKVIEAVGERIEEAATEGGATPEEAAKRSRADVEAIGETAVGIAQGVGQYGGQVALGAVSVPLALVSSGLGEAEGFREDAQAHLADEDTQLAASNLGVVLGLATEYAPIKIALGRFRDLPGGDWLIKQLGKLNPAAKGAAEVSLGGVAEAVQEGTVQVGQNLAASDFFGYDPDREWEQDLIPAAVEGGGAGLIVTGLSKAMRRRQMQEPPSPPPEPVDPTLTPAEAAVPLPADPYSADPEVAKLNRHLAFAASRGHDRIVQRLQTQRDERIKVLREAEEQKLDAEFYDSPAGIAARADMLDEVRPPSVPEQMEMTLDVFDSLPDTGTLTLDEAASLPAGQEDGSVLQRAVADFRRRGVTEVTPGELKAAMQGYLLPLNFKHPKLEPGERTIVVTTPVNFTSGWANRFAQDGYFAEVEGVLGEDGVFTLTGLRSDLFSRWSETKPEGPTVGPAPRDAALQLRKMDVERDFLKTYAPNWKQFVLRGLVRDLARQGAVGLAIKPGVLDPKTQGKLRTEFTPLQPFATVEEGEGEVSQAAFETIQFTPAHASILFSPFGGEIRKATAAAGRRATTWRRPQQAVREKVNLKALRQRRLERGKRDDRKFSRFIPPGTSRADEREFDTDQEFEDFTEEGGIGGLNPELELSNRYHTAYILKDTTLAGDDPMAYLRSAAEEMGLKGTDEQLLDAAKDAYERRVALRNRKSRYPDIRLSRTVRPPSERWTLDPGAIPGEPSFYLDAQNGDLDTASHAIIETEGGKWELMEAGGRSLGVYNTPQQAASRVDPTSRATDAQQRRAVERVQMWVQKAANVWPNGPIVNVVWTEEDLPGPRISNAAGVFDPDTREVFLVARHIKTESDFLNVYLHEVAGHFGMQGILGEDFTPTLLAIYRTNPAVRERADAYREKHADDFKGMDERRARALATEEALATMTQRDEFRRLNGLARMTAAIRSLLRKMGMKLGWTDKDTAYLLASSLRFVKTGKRSVFFSGQRGLSNADKTVSDFLGEEMERLYPPIRKLAYVEGILDPEVDHTASVVFNKFLDKVVNLEQLSKLNPKDTWLQRYTDLVRDHNAFKSTWAMEMENRLVEMKGLSEKTLIKVFDFALDATVASSKIGRRITDSELAELATKGQLVVNGPGRQNMMVTASIMDEGAFRAYLKMSKDFTHALDQIKELMDEGTRRRLAGQPTAVVEAALATNQQLYTSMLNRNYFPLARFGDYTNVVIAREDVVLEGESYKAGQVVEVSTYEKEGERNRVAKELAATYPPSKFVIHRRNNTDPPSGQRTVFIPPALEQRLLDVQGLTPELKQQIAEIFVDMQPSRAFAKRLKKQRKAIEGFSRDGLRAYADYFMRFSSYAANLKYADSLEAAINEHRKLAPESGDSPAWDDITRWMAEHKEYLLNPVTEWAALRKLVSVWHLGLNAKSALVNLTQIPMYVYPYLAARYGGDLKATSAITAGTGQIGKISRYLKDAAVGSSRIFDSQRELPDGLPQVLIELTAQQILDQGFAVHMAAIADGALKLGAKGVGARQAASWTLDKSMWMFQQMEKVNRRVTAAAAFPLALEDVGGSKAKWGDLTEAQKAEVVRQCREAVTATQFDYSRWNRPKFLRGRKGAAFIFYNFTSNSLFFLLKEPGRGRAWAMQIMMAGLLGIPFAEDVLNLLDAGGVAVRKLLGMPADFDFNSKEAIKKWVKAQMPEGWNKDLVTDTVLHGAGSQYGLGPFHLLTLAGIPIPKVDISTSLGQGDILPGTKSARALARGASGEDMRRILIDDFANAGGALFNSLLDSITSTDPGFRRIQKGMPSSMKKMYEAWQAAETGAFRRRTDQTAMRRVDWTNPEDATKLIVSGLGFNLTELRKIQSKDFAQYETAIYWQTRKALRLKALREAVLAHDTQAKQEAIKDIQEYNKVAGRVPTTRPYLITRSTIERSIGSSLKRRRLREATGATSKQNIPLAAELYGEEDLPGPEE